MGDASVTTAPEALTDEPTANGADQTRATPNRAKRYSVFPDGDVRVFLVARPEDAPTPVGCLIPLEGAPGFLTAQDARSWLRKHGGLPQGRKLLIAKIQAILELQEVTRPAIRLHERPRIERTRADLPGQQLLPPV